jgi:hypothetical protein
MPFDEKEKAMEELKELLRQDPLKGISFTNLKTGDVQMAAISTSIWEVTIRKYLKKGFIPTKAYKKNIDLINKWMVVKENVEDYTKEIEELKTDINDFLNTLNKIETDPFWGRIYTNSKSIFIERKEKAITALALAEKNLEENKKELPSLTVQVAKLKNFEHLRENGFV